MIRLADRQNASSPGAAVKRDQAELAVDIAGDASLARTPPLDDVDRQPDDLMRLAAARRGFKSPTQPSGFSAGASAGGSAGVAGVGRFFGFPFIFILSASFCIISRKPGGAPPSPAGAVDMPFLDTTAAAA